MEYTYDNSRTTLAIPPILRYEVRWGEQTSDEMAVAFLAIVLPSPNDAQELSARALMQYLETIFSQDVTLEDLPSEMSRNRGKADHGPSISSTKNKDGKLDGEERVALLQFLRNRRQ